MIQGTDADERVPVYRSAPRLPRELLHGCGRRGRKPRLELDRAFELPALAQARNDLRDQQLPLIGMEPARRE